MSAPENYAKEYLQTVSYFLFRNALDIIRTSTVENEVRTLADGKASWDANEIATMRTTSLQDIRYQTSANNAEFFIKNKQTQARISFSNRLPTRGETRGQILRDLLSDLKKKTPEMYLYDALTQIVQDPEHSTGASYFFTAACAVVGAELEEGERLKRKAAIREAFLAIMPLCIELLNAAEKRKELDKLDKFLEGEWSKIISILSQLNPAQIKFDFTKYILNKTVQGLAKDDLRRIAGENLLAKIDTAKATYPEEGELLSKVLWQTHRILSQPNNMQHQLDYVALSNDIKHSEEPRRCGVGKIIGGAILAVVFATSFALCCASSFGAALPFLAWGLSYLIPAIVGSSIFTLAGLTLFAKGVQEDREESKTTEPRADVMAVTDAMSQVVDRSVSPSP